MMGVNEPVPLGEGEFDGDCVRVVDGVGVVDGVPLPLPVLLGLPVPEGVPVVLGDGEAPMLSVADADPVALRLAVLDGVLLVDGVWLGVPDLLLVAVFVAESEDEGALDAEVVALGVGVGSRPVKTAFAVS
jgi:hypothetical protein